MKPRMLYSTIAALVLPSVIVVISPRIGTLPGPSTAVATPLPEDAPHNLAIEAPRAARLTEAQQAAIAHRQQLTAAPANNPFYYPVPQDSDPNPYPYSESTDQNTTPTTSDEQQQTTPNAPPTMIISSMASAQGKGIAIINGTLRNEGDSIADGWTIQRIEPSTRSVTIRHTDGTTHTESQAR